MAAATNEFCVATVKPFAAAGTFEDAYKALSDDELRAKTDEFRERLAQGEVLDDLICPRHSLRCASLPTAP